MSGLLQMSGLNLNGLLVTRQIDNTTPGGCARREISPWLSGGECSKLWQSAGRRNVFVCLCLILGMNIYVSELVG